MLLAFAGCNSPGVAALPEPAGPSASAAAQPGAAASSAAAPAPPPSASASATASAPPPSPEAAREMLARAEKCFLDLQCSPAQAEALYRGADDGGAPGVSCFAFYYGINVTRDLPRARACFERQVKAGPACNGSSPDLDRMMLASMLIDAQGGSAEPERAMALLAGCFEDASVQGIKEQAQKRRDLAPSREPLDFCKDEGGTTITIGQCHLVETQRLQANRLRVEREIAPRLDADGKRLSVKAQEAWSAFAAKQAEANADRYRGGSLQSNAQRSGQNELEQRRVEALSHLFEYRLSPGADPAAADRAVEGAYKEARQGDAHHAKLFEAARAAWKRYRDAEIALYVHLFGKGLGEREVKRDVQAMLTKGYQAILEDAVKP